MSVLSAQNRQQIVGGQGFILDAPDHVPAIFGHGREVLWAVGESLLIVGPQGVGKTTIMQQLALRRAGVTDGSLIGFPVEADTERLTLYLALDRPSQISRSFRRMVSEVHEQRLGRLVVWKGPLPFNLVKDPELLIVFLQEIGAAAKTPIGTVFADSLKDMAWPLSSDEVGAAANRAIGGVIAQGIEFAATHHQRKANSENRKPTSLADVYGSTWITAGAGSVLSVWGEAGDPLVELTHIKQPADEVGPLELAHEHEQGQTTRVDRPNAWTILQAATSGGVTAPAAAVALYGEKVTKAQIEKARRKLDRYAEDGHAVKIPGKQAADPTLYRPTRVDPRGPERGPSTQSPRLSTNGSVEPHASPTSLTASPVTSPTPLRGDRDGIVDHDDELPGGRTLADLEAIVAEHGG